MKKGKLKIYFMLGIVVTMGLSSSTSVSAADPHTDIWWVNFWNFYGHDFDTNGYYIAIYGIANGVIETNYIIDLAENGDPGFTVGYLYQRIDFVLFDGTTPKDAYTITDATQNLAGCFVLMTGNPISPLTKIAEVCVDIYVPRSGGGGGQVLIPMD